MSKFYQVIQIESETNFHEEIMEKVKNGELTSFSKCNGEQREWITRSQNQKKKKRSL